MHASVNYSLINAQVVRRTLFVNHHLCRMPVFFKALQHWEWGRDTCSILSLTMHPSKIENDGLPNLHISEHKLSHTVTSFSLKIMMQAVSWLKEARAHTERCQKTLYYPTLPGAALDVKHLSCHKKWITGRVVISQEVSRKNRVLLRAGCEPATS